MMCEWIVFDVIKRRLAAVALIMICRCLVNFADQAARKSLLYKALPL
jgi:hypothetical protein